MTLGFAFWQIVVLLARGPGLDRSDSIRGKRWIGWNGTGLESWNRKKKGQSDVEVQGKTQGDNQTIHAEDAKTETASVPLEEKHT